MHLRRVGIRKGTVALSSRGGEELHSLPVLSVLCPAQTEVASLGLLLLDHPEPTGVGGWWSRGCEVTTCDCQQQRRGWGKSWWRRRGKVTTLLGCWAIKTP